MSFINSLCLCKVKKQYAIILSLLMAVVFAGCGKQGDVSAPLFAFDDGLLRADSIMQHDPDSALRVLVSRRNGGNSGEISSNAPVISTGAEWSGEISSNAPVISTAAEQSGEISSLFNENYRSLLLSEALYKTDNPQTDIAALQSATHYFDSLAECYPANDDFTVLSARSHYMNGAISYENDSVVEACKEYLHTLEIMEDHFEDKELVGYKAKFMALTYNRLVDLFSNQFMMEPAVYCGKKALYFCMIEPTSKYGLSNTIFKLGKYYDMLGKKDCAYQYYNKALKHLPDTNNRIYRDIVSNMALLSYELDCNAEKSINDFEKILKQTRSDEEILSRYIGIGYIYYNEGIYDSATVYLKHVFDITSTDVMKLKAAEYLQNIYQSTDNYEEADKYSKYLATLITTKYSDMMEVSILNKLFDDYLEQLKYKQQYHDKKKTIHFIIAISVIITSIISVLIHIKNRKMKDINTKYDREKTKVDNFKKEIIRKRSESELRIECFLNEPVCRRINDTIRDIPVSARSKYSDYTYLELDEVTIVELGEAVTKHFPNLKTRLLSNDIKLKKGDLLLCYLYLLGLNNSQIALLRQCNFATVCRQANRLKKSFTGCEDLPNFIKKLALD